MKKWTILVAAVLSVCVLALSGCASAPVAKNNLFSVLKEDETYVLRFHEQQKTQAGSALSGSEAAHILEFSSVSEMKASILEGKFTEEDVQGILQFDKSAKGDIYLFDLDKMYEPVLPEGMTYDVRWNGNAYAFANLSGLDGWNVIAPNTKEEYDQNVEALYDFLEINDGIKQSALEDREGTVYEYTSKFGKHVRVVVYTLTSGNKTMLVRETYSGDSSASSFSGIDFCGVDNGIYFEGSLNERASTSEEWLLSFGIQPYTGS